MRSGGVMERDGFMVTYEKCGLQPISMEGTNLTYRQDSTEAKIVGKC